MQFARFIWRPNINDQNTGRAAYQRSLGYATVSVDGAGGHTYNRSLSPFNAATINPRKVRTASITGTGNATNTNPNLDPLANMQNNVVTGAQI